MTYCFGGQFICHEFIVTDSSRSFHFHIHFCQSQHCIIGKVLLIVHLNVNGDSTLILDISFHLTLLPLWLRLEEDCKAS